MASITPSAAWAIRSTPWGAPQSVEKLTSGVYSVTTASHGGIYCDPIANATIPADWRRASWSGRGMTGWYEEDADWSMVALTFPEAFKPSDLLAARRTFDAWIAPKLTVAA